MTINATPKISVVVPVYNGAPFIKSLFERVRGTLAEMNLAFELILIEDGGPDNSWQVIKTLVEQHPEIRGAQLSRNFGQHKAITAGLSMARGEWIVVMDCDLQDQPEEIKRLYTKTREGFDIVLARRLARKDSFLKRLSSKMFNDILGYLTETKSDPAVANFGIYHQNVINSVLAMRDSFPSFPVMTRWVGYRTASVNVEHANRPEGLSNYNFSRSLNLALDTILAFSDKPLRLIVKTGVTISATAFLAAVAIIISWIRQASSQPGWASIIVSIWFFSGLIIFILGVVGLYVGKTYEQTKQRPLFIINKRAYVPGLAPLNPLSTTDSTHSSVTQSQRIFMKES